jgi:hypothetical protein
MPKTRTLILTLAWFLVLVVFGLLQLWYTVAFDYFNDKDLHLFIHVFNGGFLFFCASVIALCAFDVWIMTKMVSPSFIFMHIVFPLLILVFICILYSVIIGGELKYSQKYINANISLLLGSLLYATLTRIIIWKEVDDRPIQQ